MKKIASVVLVAAGLGLMPAQAGEVGLLLDKQIGDSSLLGAGKVDAVSPTGFGIRGAFTVLDLKVAELGIAATYHPEAKGDFNIGGKKVGTFSDQYVAIGAQVDWKLLVNVHAGLDLRQEKSKTEDTGIADSSTTYTRPWVKAGIGFSIPTPIVSPFVRLEAAYALQTYSLPSNPSKDDINKAMAPKYQIAVYGGIRF